MGVAGNVALKDEQSFRQLLVVDSLRGSDSTGVASINRANTVKIAKQIGDPYTVMEFPQFKQAFNGQVKCLIGHNRFATTGKINRKNAHPFEIENIIGAHNGTLTNKWNLLDPLEFDTDSETLFNHIEKKGLRDAINIAEGAYALVWYDKEQDTINFLRNKERPLCFSFDEKREKLYWASEPWMLEGILWRNDVKHDEVVEVLQDHHYSFKIPKIGESFEKIKLMKVAQKEKPKPFTPPAGGCRTSSTNIVSHPKFNKHLKGDEQKALDKLYDLNGHIVHLEVDSFGTSEYGALFVTLTCEKYPLQLFRVYVKSEVEKKIIVSNKYWIGTVKDVGYSIMIGAFYKLDYASMEVLKKPKHFINALLSLPDVEDTIKDYKGRLITKGDFDKKYSLCCWCNCNLDFSKDLRIVSESDCLCESCATDDEIKQYLPNAVN